MTTTTVSCAASRGPSGPLSPRPCCQPSSGVTSAGGRRYRARRARTAGSTNRGGRWGTRARRAPAPSRGSRPPRTPPRTARWWRAARSSWAAASARRRAPTPGRGGATVRRADPGSAARPSRGGARCGASTSPVRQRHGIQLVRVVEHASRTRATGDSAAITVIRGVGFERARGRVFRAGRRPRRCRTSRGRRRSLTSSRSWSTKLVYTSLVGDVSANPIVVSVADRSWSVRVSTSATCTDTPVSTAKSRHGRSRRFVEGQAETLGREVQLRGRLVTAVLADGLVDHLDHAGREDPAHVGPRSATRGGRRYVRSTCNWPLSRSPRVYSDRIVEVAGGRAPASGVDLRLALRVGHHRRRAASLVEAPGELTDEPSRAH